MFRWYLLIPENALIEYKKSISSHRCSFASRAIALPLSHGDFGCWDGVNFYIYIFSRDKRDYFDINTGIFLGKMCSDRRQNHGRGEKKREGTNSPAFGVGTAAECCVLKRCADRVRSRTEERERQILVRNLNFTPSTFSV